MYLFFFFKQKTAYEMRISGGSSDVCSSYLITGTAGVFGAAAAVGRLLGLDAGRMTWALGIAATQSPGLREMFGTMCKSLHPGRAAQNGARQTVVRARVCQ